VVDKSYSKQFVEMEKQEEVTVELLKFPSICLLMLLKKERGLA